MFNKIIILLFAITTVSYAQFSNIEISLDLRNISKEFSPLMKDLENNVVNYFENTIFSEEDSELSIPLKIHVVIESLSSKNASSMISAQFFISNNYDLNQYSKSCVFPYYKGESISFSTEFHPLGSLLDYFAYIYLGNEIDGLEKLGGGSFYNLAEKISVKGKESNLKHGWEDRWRKCKKIIENTHLRDFRFNWYELQYNYYDIKPQKKIIKKNIEELVNDIYYLKEFYPNDRNTFLFLDIYAKQIADILGEHKMYEAIIMLSGYDLDNKKIYNSQLK